MTSSLLQPYDGPHLQLSNRIAMAPMTRYRSDPETGVPGPMVATYYRQRASAGLIITEGIWPTRRGIGGPGVPGLADSAQRDGWRPVTAAVHEVGGRIYAQLWHVGRLAHPSMIPGHLAPLAPSAVPAPGVARLGTRRLPYADPQPMTVSDIAETIDAYAAAASRAVAAGFEGVEIHGANGYLVHQFLADNTNTRTDAYGRDRLRFPLELVDAVIRAIGPERVAMRLSPGNPENDVVEDDPATTYRELVTALDRLGLCYLHLSEKGRYRAHEDLRPLWSGTLVGNFDRSEPSDQRDGEALLAAGLADVVAYGRLFIANPDLPARFAAGAPLAEVDRAHLYAGGACGYTDYPAHPAAS